MQNRRPLVHVTDNYTCIMFFDFPQLVLILVYYIDRVSEHENTYYSIQVITFQTCIGKQTKYPHTSTDITKHYSLIHVINPHTCISKQTKQRHTSTDITKLHATIHVITFQTCMVNKQNSLTILQILPNPIIQFTSSPLTPV